MDENMEITIQCVYCIFVVFHTIDRLQVNILRHTLVPKMFILDEKEKDEIKQKLNLKEFSQLPEISRFDGPTVAIFLGFHGRRLMIWP